MSHPPRPPVGDVLDGLVAIVEQETAKLGNRDANLPNGYIDCMRQTRIL